MAKNDFKAFATDRNANVMSQEEWEALPALLSGFTAGKASSAQVNKVIRQASFIAAALAQFVSDKTQRDVLDNGDLPGFVELLGSGFAVEYLSRKNPFGDIKSDGTVKTALENLGLGEGSALPVGVPVPWPAATPPTGWLKCNGAAFSAEEYPELAKAYPTNKLPDLRGEFMRGWDDG
ncbi:phage tail protein, partial [Escherichia coli]